MTLIFPARWDLGYMMVMDLQGSPRTKEGEYVLTDPAILCSDLLRFGSTNFGTPKMMKRCVLSIRNLLEARAESWKV